MCNEPLLQQESATTSTKLKFTNNNSTIGSARAAAEAGAEDHMNWSWLNLVLCFCIGVVAVSKSLDVQRAWRMGDVRRAQARSQAVRRLNKVGSIVGAIFTITIVCCIIVYMKMCKDGHCPAGWK